MHIGDVGSSDESVPGMHYEDGSSQLRRYTRWLAFAIAAIYGAQTAISGILLPNQVQDLRFDSYFVGADSDVDLQELTDLDLDVEDDKVTPTAEQRRLLDIYDDFDASRASSLALAAALAAVGLTISQLLIGSASDRTRSRWGRRGPWIIGAGIMGAVFIAALRYAPSIAAVAGIWAVINFAIGLAVTPLQASVADRVPESKRGVVSAMSGLGTFAGGILGAVIAGVLFGALDLDLYFLMALLFLFGSVMFAIRAPDTSSLDIARATSKMRDILRGFLVPLRSSDFRWVWVARVLLIFGFGVSTNLQFFILQSYIEPALSASEATKIVPLLVVSSLPATLIAVVVAGKLSDRIGRRKPFVIAASVLMSLSFLIPLVSPTLPALFAQIIIGGIAFGMFLPVDQALFIDVLPHLEDAGRDLGIAAIATNLGLIIAPIAAAVVVEVSGGYQMLWPVSLVLVAGAGLAILPVRGAR